MLPLKTGCEAEGIRHDQGNFMIEATKMLLLRFDGLTSMHRSERSKKVVKR